MGEFVNWSGSLRFTPAEAFRHCFAEVRARIIERHRRYVGWRELCRTVAQDEGYLGPYHGRPTMTIALLQNITLPHEPYHDDLEPVLRAYGGRPHRGKKHSLTARELAPLYPAWGRFATVRERLDPDGVPLRRPARAAGGIVSPLGRRTWVLPAGQIPVTSTGPGPEYASRDDLIVLDTGDGPASIEITVYYGDREPVVPYHIAVDARRLRVVRFNGLIDPEAIPLGADYAAVVRSDVPVVVQHVRIDTRQAELALFAAPGFAPDG